MQEIEIESGFDCELLNIPGYSFEFETNNVKRRVGSYIKNSIKYHLNIQTFCYLKATKHCFTFLELGLIAR